MNPQDNNFQQTAITSPLSSQSAQVASQSERNQEKADSGLSTASMVIGIISLVIFPICLLLAVVGLILGIIGYKKGCKKKAGIILNSIALGLELIFAVILVGIVATGSSMNCTSAYGDITLLYNDSGLNGYAVTGAITFDFDEQQVYAKNVGIERYLDTFEQNWISDMYGTCTKK